MSRLLTTSLPEFLSTGTCGPLRQGATRRQIASLCGRPSEDGARLGAHKPLYCFYGSIEIGFSAATDVVAYVQIENTDRRGRFRGFRRIALRSHGCALKGCDIPTFRRFARAHGIRLIRVLPPWHDPEVMCLATKAGVVAWFGRDVDSGETWLQSLITEDISRFGGRRVPGMSRRSIRRRHPVPSGLKTAQSRPGARRS
ncbi:hypothetical protein [Inquilinus sp. CA228]|uniref:hypothetical protein n=1 Tax=Inquilinus sp. CA228 TaxID=3455609 RepID=UPI003F8D2556